MPTITTLLVSMLDPPHESGEAAAALRTQPARSGSPHHNCVHWQALSQRNTTAMGSLVGGRTATSSEPPLENSFVRNGSWLCTAWVKNGSGGSSTGTSAVHQLA